MAIRNNITFITAEKKFSSNEIIKRAKTEYEIQGGAVKDIKSLDIEFDIQTNKLTAIINEDNKNSINIPMK